MITWNNSLELSHYIEKDKTLQEIEEKLETPLAFFGTTTDQLNQMQLTARELTTDVPRMRSQLERLAARIKRTEQDALEQYQQTTGIVEKSVT